MDTMSVVKIAILVCFLTLSFEKDVVGFYLSGHPLDSFKKEMECFCNIEISELSDLVKLKNKEIAFAGIVTSAEHRMTKTGKPFGVMFIEDFSGSFEYHEKFGGLQVHNGWF